MNIGTCIYYQNIIKYFMYNQKKSRPYDSVTIDQILRCYYTMIFNTKLIRHSGSNIVAGPL